MEPRLQQEYYGWHLSRTLLSSAYDVLKKPKQIGEVGWIHWQYIFHCLTSDHCHFGMIDWYADWTKWL